MNYAKDTKDPASPPLDPPQTSYDLGNCTFCALAGELQSNYSDSFIHFEPKVCLVFECLIKANGNVVKREDIFDYVWPNMIVSDDSLNRCISVLRQQLKAFDHQIIIKTHPKIGFHIEIAANKTINIEPNQLLSLQETSQTPVIATEDAINSIETHKKNKRKLPKKLTYLMSLAVFCILVILGYFKPLLISSTELPNPSTDRSDYRLVILPFAFPEPVYEKYTSLNDEFMALIANHPEHSLVAKNEVLNVENYNISALGEKFNARYIIRGQFFYDNQRDILTWQIIDTKNSDIVFTEQINLAIYDIKLSALEISTKIFTVLADQYYSNDTQAKTQYIVKSANHLLNLQAYSSSHRPIIVMLANAMSLGQQPNIMAVKALVQAIKKIIWSVYDNKIPYSNLAIQSLKTAIQSTPKDAELYQDISYFYAITYQWQLAYQALEIATQITTISNLPMLIEYPLLPVSGLSAMQLADHYQVLLIESPNNFEIAFNLIQLYLANNNVQQALDVANSLLIAENQWQVIGAIIGPILIKTGEFDIGERLTRLGYQFLGLGDNEINNFIIALENKHPMPVFSLENSDLSLSPDLNNVASLFMFAELGDLEQYFKLAFTLIANKKFPLLALSNSNSHIIKADPRYKLLLTEIGLHDFWQKHDMNENI